MSFIVGGNLTATTGAKSVVTMLIPADASQVTVDLEGTFSATLIAEVSNDGGRNYNQPSTTLSQSGLTIFPVGGLTHFRVRCTVFGSGSVGCTLNAGPEGNIGSTSGPGNTRSLQFVIDGGGSTPATGSYGQISIPYACTLRGWVLTADQSGSAVIDVLRSSYAGFPTTTSIAGSAKPTLSSVQKNENLTLAGWGNQQLSNGDELQINLNSVATVTRLNLTIIITVP
jgi:hypothetical protein